MSHRCLYLLIFALILAGPAQASRHDVASLSALTTASTDVPSDTRVVKSATTAGSKNIHQGLNPIAPAKAEPRKFAAKATRKSSKPDTKSVVAAIAPQPVAAKAILEPLVRLARLTAYWTQEDPWTAQHQSSTGVRLHEGHCAVDPKLIPYGSMVQIPGMGNYVAVDTGSAVISRQAAIGSGQNDAQRNALVVDLFFETRKDAEAFASHGPSYVAVSWSKLTAAPDSPLNPRALPAIPKLPAGTIYFLAQAPSLADASVPLAFRKPKL